MLDTSCNSVCLNSLDVWDHHLAREEGIFSHVLEITAVQRGTADVDAGAEEDIFLAIAGFFADAVSVKAGEFAIPCRGKIRKSRESCA